MSVHFHGHNSSCWKRGEFNYLNWGHLWVKWFNVIESKLNLTYINYSYYLWQKTMHNQQSGFLDSQERLIQNKKYIYISD